MRNPIAVLFAAAASLALIAPAAAQTYPSRTITMIVPFAAGGASDVIARIVAEEMGKHLGQRIIAENIGGAGGSIALQRAAAAAPDGHTILAGNSGTNAAGYTIYANFTLRPDAFAGIGLLARTASVIAIKRDLAQRDVASLVAHARANPGLMTFGHAGVGTSNYLICRQFTAAAGIDVTLVSYRGAGPARQDLMVGSIDAVCDNATSIAPQIASGDVRGLVVAGATRLAAIPNVPTNAEAGLPTFQAAGWNALFVPAATPAPIRERLLEALRAALDSDFVKRRFEELVTTLPTPEERSPAFVDALVQRDTARFRELLGRR